MEYIDSCDLDYILNKYHDTQKPFNSMNRFIRHDEIFDPESGMEAEALYEAVKENDRLISGESHPMRKAKALAMLLEHTRIACDPRDRFPALNILDRPIARCIVNAWRGEVFGQIMPDVEKRRGQLERDGVVAIWPDYDHSVPVWERVFTLGFPGLIREADEAENKLAKDHCLSQEEQDFYASIRVTYEAMITLCRRLRLLAEGTNGSERLAKALCSLETGAPRNTYEVLLIIYLYFMVSEHVDSLQVRSLCNMDVMLYPYYKKDLENGISEDELRKDLAYFLLQFTAIGNYWNQPFYLGGMDENGVSLVNPLSYVILDIYDRMGIYNPKIQIKTAESTPKDFVCKALDMIRRGHSCIVFVSDLTIQTALMNSGATPEQARTCRIHGCYEYSVEGSVNAGMNYVNLLKPMEYAMHEGCDGITGKATGLPAPAEYPTFAAFYDEYKRQLSHVIDTIMEVVNTFEDYLDYINPQPLLSATIPLCIEHARDAYGGGAVDNESNIAFGFIADLADSLTQIKRLVFDEHRYTMKELRTILDKDFEGEEKLRLSLLLHPEKYGNNRETPDGFARDISAFIAGYVNGKPNAKRRGGHWKCGFHVARMSYMQAPMTASSPNGRLRGEELSKNVSASMGQNREGITAAILSATKIDATKFCGDAALDAGLLPSAVQGDDGLEAMYGLLMTFIRRKGHAIHFNVFDADTLRRAQEHPEQYRDLQIRVCGWNVLFNNINKKEQDGFIRQAEALL